MFSFDHHLIGNTFCPRFLLIAGVLGIFFLVGSFSVFCCCCCYLVWIFFQKYRVLVSAGIELIFFLVIGAVLRFGFGMRITFKTRCWLLLSCVYTKSRLLPLLWPEKGTRNWEGTELAQLTPAEPRDIPDHVLPC